jgi:hypothetical protein
MKAAILGKQQDINPLTTKIKDHDFFKLLGTYFTDSRTLKVAQSTIISPFGLINHANCVMFQKTDETSFNLLLEAVKSSKHLLILNPHTLTLEETSELLKVSVEAEIDVYVVSSFLLNSSMEYLFKSTSLPRLTEVFYENPDNAGNQETHSLPDKIIYLTDAVLSLSRANIKKVIPFITTTGSHEIITIIIEFDNSSTAILRFSSVAKSENCVIRVVNENEICEASPLLNSYTINTFKGKIQQHTQKSPNPESLILSEFENAIHSESTRLTKLIDFQKSQKVLKSILEKKESL